MKISLNQQVLVTIGVRNTQGTVVDTLIVPAVASGFYKHPTIGKILEVTFPSGKSRLITESQIPSTLLEKSIEKVESTEMEF
jgi:hypothetical protein